MPAIEVFTDGACSGNPGAGGWGVILRYGEIEKELSGGEENTTNNRMELTAVIEAIYTDSRYVMDGVQEWMPNWKLNGWKTTNKKSPVKNVELWQILDSLLSKHKIKWVWVKGHNGHPENERVDKLARDEAKKYAVTKV